MTVLNQPLEQQKTCIRHQMKIVNLQVVPKKQACT